MTAYLDFPVGLKEKLWSHLLQSDIEQVAFVFAAVAAKGDATVLTARDYYLAAPGDFEIHSEFHVELTDETRSRIIKHAWDTGTTPVELHSHPGDMVGAMFSPSDMYGFSDFVPHCRWRLRGRPYLAIVVSPAGADALAWIDKSGQPVGLRAMIHAANSAGSCQATILGSPVYDGFGLQKPSWQGSRYAPTFLKRSPHSDLRVFSESAVGRVGLECRGLRRRADLAVQPHPQVRRVAHPDRGRLEELAPSRP